VIARANAEALSLWHPITAVCRRVAVGLFMTIAGVASAQTQAGDTDLAARIEALVPQIEAYIGKGMAAFDVPVLAIGIVAGDLLVYARGFGVRIKDGKAPVGTRTIFQIGSTTKAFLAATQAIMVDRGNLRWDDRVVDLYPEFQLQDPWVDPRVPRLRSPGAEVGTAGVRQ
jgi:CubicO group peptidase (beta-lactamase class C family)